MKFSFHYVYILVSGTDNTRHSTGLTQALNACLLAHNSGQVSHDSRFRPWRIENAVAFRSREKADALEYISRAIPAGGSQYSTSEIFDFSRANPLQDQELAALRMTTHIWRSAWFLRMALSGFSHARRLELFLKPELNRVERYPS